MPSAATARSGLSRALAAALALPIHLYRLVLSPLLPPACRFEPSCSAYALEALRLHGPAKGLWLTARRLARCHPIAILGGGSGFDPVPPHTHPCADSHHQPAHH